MSRARVREIAVLAARLWGVPLDRLAGQCRWQPVVRARQAVYLVAYENGHSTPRIGSIMRRDHSSVLHGKMKAADMARRDEDFAEFLQALRMAAANITESLDAEWWRATAALPNAKSRPERRSRAKAAQKVIPDRPRIILAPATPDKKARNQFEPITDKDRAELTRTVAASALLAAKMLEARAA